MKLTDNFLEPYKTAELPFGPLGYVIYKRTYARTKPDGTLEDWWETVRRVVEGAYRMQREHCSGSKLPWNAHKAQSSAQRMYDLIFNAKFLPAGRSLYSGGTDYIFERTPVPLYNCAIIDSGGIVDNVTHPFEYFVDLLMLGTGVSYTLDGAGKVRVGTPRRGNGTLVVEDSKEGWVSVIAHVIAAYLDNKTLLNIDFSLIRPAGSLIKTFGGVAPGPQPLERCIKEIHELFEGYEGPITITQLNDLFCILAKCVVSGGLRRSACLALGPDDDEFLDLKNPDDDKLLQYRWAANNSIRAEVGQDYSKVADMTARNGEPGYVWLQNCRNFARMGEPADDGSVVGVNPCAEATLENRELCNLVSIFPAKHDNIDDLKQTIKYAFLYAKSMTLMPTHREEINRVIMKNRRIGLSMSGVTQAITKFGYRKFMTMCDDCYKETKRVDVSYSGWLCVPYSIKLTTVVPSGTTSHLANATPGVHFPHSAHYYRTIRIDKNSKILQPLRDAGYLVEESLYGDNSYIAYFPIHEDNFDRCKEEVSLWEQMCLLRDMQRYWADQSVSITVTFKPEEAKDIQRVLEYFETDIKSVSFLPLVDHQYKQAPYITIDEEEYKKATSRLKPLDLSSVVHEMEDKYCNSDSCEVTK